VQRGSGVALTFTCLLVLSACGEDDPPDYLTTAAVADALHEADINCDLELPPPASSLPSLVESAGVCRGVDFVIHIFLYRDAPARQQSQAESMAYWCDQGVTEGSYVSAGRWLVTMDPSPTDGSLFMSDIADATGGSRNPVDCD